MNNGRGRPGPAEERQHGKNGDARRRMIGQRRRGAAGAVRSCDPPVRLAGRPGDPGADRHLRPAGARPERRGGLRRTAGPRLHRVLRHRRLRLGNPLRRRADQDAVHRVRLLGGVGLLDHPAGGPGHQYVHRGNAGISHPEAQGRLPGHRDPGLRGDRPDRGQQPRHGHRRRARNQPHPPPQDPDHRLRVRPEPDPVLLPAAAVVGGWASSSSRAWTTPASAGPGSPFGRTRWRPRRWGSRR